MVFLWVSPQQAIDFDWLVQQLTVVGYDILIFSTMVLLGYVIGRLVGTLVGKVVGKLGADSTMRKTAMGRFILKSGLTASDFAKLIAKWTIYISSILIALDMLNIPFIEAPVQSIIGYMPRLIGALIIFVFGAIVSDWVGEIVKKGFSEEERQVLFVNLMGNLLKIFIYFIIITITLSQIGVDVTILQNIAQAFAWGFAIFMGIAAGIILGWVLKDRLKEILSQ